MYTEKIYSASHTVAHEIFYKGEYGQKGSKRRERQRTPEEIAKWNHARKVKNLQHKIQANFKPGEHFITLKYPKGERPSMDTVLKHFDRFRRYIKRDYKRQGRELKYIYAVEIGSKGGIHLHVIISGLENALELFTLAWSKARGTTTIEDMIAEGTTELPKMVRLDGKVDMQLLYLEGAYHELAEYLCKFDPGEMTREEQKERYRFNCSRNLVDPEPERKEFTRRTVRKLIEAGPEKINTDPFLRKKYLSPGFLIDRSTWHVGVNPVTGLSFLEYTEVRVT